jgi:uncharacterized surface protein with fasciclin (FAS1) repeats
MKRASLSNSVHTIGLTAMLSIVVGLTATACNNTETTVAVQVGHSSVKVNNATVVKADIDAKNGVVHVIDKVLLPPNL